MVLDKIIEIELGLLSKTKIPTKIFMSIETFDALVIELDATRYLCSVHNMDIEITKSKSTQLLLL